MKHLKITGLLMATATLAFTASASADYVTTTTGGPVATPTIHAVNEGGHVTLKNAIANISCSSTAEGKVESHGGFPGGTFIPVSGNLSTFTFSSCTNSWHVTTEKGGVLWIQSILTYRGTVYSDGARLATTRFGVFCVYETNDTHIGTLTGGSPATLDIQNASIPLDKEASSQLCGSGNATWEGSYVLTSALYVETGWPEE